MIEWVKYRMVISSESSRWSVDCDVERLSDLCRTIGLRKNNEVSCSIALSRHNLKARHKVKHEEGASSSDGDGGEVTTVLVKTR